MLDMKAAFDRVERVYLMQLLAKTALGRAGRLTEDDGAAMRWVDNFHTGRRLVVRVDE